MSPCLRSDATSRVSLCCASWPVAPEGRGWRGTDPWPPVHRREVGPRRRPLSLFFLPLALVTEQPGLCTLGILQDWWVTSWGSTWPRCLFRCKTERSFLTDAVCSTLAHAYKPVCTHGLFHLVAQLFRRPPSAAPRPPGPQLLGVISMRVLFLETCNSFSETGGVCVAAIFTA